MALLKFNSTSISLPDDVAEHLSDKGLIALRVSSSDQDDTAEFYTFFGDGRWREFHVRVLLHGILDSRATEIGKANPVAPRLPKKFRTLLLLSCAMGRPIGVTSEEYHDFQKRFIDVMEIQKRLVPRGYMNLFINGRAFAFIDRPDESDDERILHAFSTHGTIVTLTEPE